MQSSENFLSVEFLSKYENLQPRNKGILFEPVFYRTYSRYIPEKKRRETWLEVIQRVVEASLLLYSGHKSKEDQIKEAEELFDSLFHLESYPAGRTYWIAGTKAAKELGESSFNCFSHDTEFITDKGIKKFSDFIDGDSAVVLNRFSGWQEAKVKKFGKSELRKLTLKRGTSVKIIYTTPNHRWIIKPLKAHISLEKVTDNLSKGDLIPIVRRFASNSKEINLCNVGIQHGIVFGDGTYVKSDNKCRIDLVDDSQDLSKYFTTGLISKEGKNGGKITNRFTRIFNLPSFWKNLPELTVNCEYLYGFLSGWFAADGYISKTGQMCLNSSNKENLEWARSAFSLLGIYTTDIKVQRELSPFDGSYKPLYRLNIYKDEISDSNFFLRESHKNKFSKLQISEVKVWTVDSVEKTNRYEDVWCIQEPKFESFTLSQGILTRNCCYTTIDSLEKFSQIFHLLMCGCGVGYGVQKEDVDKLPNLSSNIIIKHQPYNPRHKDNRLESTEFDYGSTINKEFLAYLEIGDSKSAWVFALQKFLQLLSLNKEIILEINYDSIRPAGERIKTFGGRAAGPNGMKEMFDGINNIVRECKGKLTPVACMDIANIIAKNVLVGGVRRSAQIALGSEDDDDFRDAKVGLFTLPHMKDKRHRVMSNNSLVFKRKPSKEKLREVFERIKTSWEPGFMNYKAASKRRPWFAGLNPCGEACLSDKGNCNLSGINLMAFVKGNKFDLHDAEKAIRLVTRLGIRQTNITWSLSDWDETHKRDRLLGVSLTGVMDAFDSLDIEFDSNKAITILQHLNLAANDEADRYSFEMRIPRPLLVCLMKPEGTISKLMTVSPGMARDRAPYYIRRIRISELDPVCKALKEIGVPNEPDISKPDRIVFSFPIKTKAKISANDESAVRQYERYLIFQKYYSDHNTSCTINVGHNEWEDLIDKVDENWDDTIACAFAAKDYSQYPQLPEEEITKEEYEAFPKVDMSDLYSIINKYELDYEEEFELDNECKGGSCPVR